MCALLLSLDELQLLLGTQLFEGFSKQELSNAIQGPWCSIKSYARGSTIYAAGARIKRAGIVLSGEVSLERLDLSGSRSLLRQMQIGELFGEVFAVLGEAITHDVVAQASSRILFFDLSALMQEEQAVAKRMLLNLLYISMRRNLYLVQKVQHITRRGIRAKLLAYLRSCAEQNAATQFVIPYTRQELADYLAVDRSALSAEIGKMCREGLLRVQKRHFELLYGALLED